MAVLCCSRGRVASQSLNQRMVTVLRTAGGPRAGHFQSMTGRFRGEAEACPSACLACLVSRVLGPGEALILCLPELGQGGQCCCQTAGDGCGPECWGLCKRKPIRFAKVGLACWAASAVGALRAGSMPSLCRKHV